MNSLTRVLVIFLAVLSTQGSAASIISGINSLSLADTTSNLSFNNVLDLINTTESTEDFKLDLNGLTDAVNVILTSILSSPDSVSDDGLLDLESFFTNFNITNLDISNITNLDISNITLDDVLNSTSLIQQLKNVDLTKIVNSLSVNTSEDASLDTVGLARKYNLPIEAHNVTTEDGYILQIFHIPGNGSLVLLLHGILGTSDDYLQRGEISLGYQLAKNDCDTWFINFRGNRYSRRHITLNPDTDKKFWDFSMHERGYYDLAASIDYVLNKTEQDELNVIGHSEGNAETFVLTSIKTRYNNKIKRFMALSPVCDLSDSGNAIKAGIHLWPILNKFLLATGNEELLGYNSFSRKLVQLICSQGAVGYDLCYRVVLGSTFGYYPRNLDQKFFHTFLGHFPAGASRKEVEHYVQIGKKDAFVQFDYGTKNIEVYGSETAPNYNLKNVTCNVILVVSKNDKIFGLNAGERLRGELPNVVDYYVVEDESFTHVDFVVGRNAYEVLYPYLIDKLNSEF